MRRFLVTVLFVMISLIWFVPGSQAAKLGLPFRVNTATAGSQDNPSVARLLNGNFIVVWVSEFQDGSGPGIYGQRYTAAGVKLGVEFKVNTYVTNTQDNPAVAALSDGNFVVTWSSFGKDTSGYGVYGQRYSAAGVQLGGEFRINSFLTDDQDSPAVAGLLGGGFVVVWISFGQDHSEEGIYGQRFSNAGARLGPEFRVNSYTTDQQRSPAITALNNGGFVATWSSLGEDGSERGLYAQRYSAAGVPLGNPFRVNSFTPGDQHRPSIGGLLSGDFIVVWSSTGQDGSLDGVYGRRYTAAGVKVGVEFRVNTRTVNDQTRPAVAALTNGRFVVTWQSNGQDGSGFGVYGQLYTAAGVKIGTEFRVNTVTANGQERPAVAGLQGGGYVVTWHSNLQDGSSNGVYGQRFGP